MSTSTSEVARVQDVSGRVFYAYPDGAVEDQPTGFMWAPGHPQHKEVVQNLLDAGADFSPVWSQAQLAGYLQARGVALVGAPLDPSPAVEKLPGSRPAWALWFGGVAGAFGLAIMGFYGVRAVRSWGSR
jgi:hypothetical protein